MFVFKGISSEEMEVVAEEEQLFLAKSSQKYEQIDINGMNGAIFNLNGYAVIERPIKLQILNKNKLDKIFEWLNGVGEFEYQSRITNAQFLQTIEPERNSLILIADMNFIRDPFWNKKRDEYIEVKNTIFNEGTIYSEPIFKLVRGSANQIIIKINGVIIQYDFPENEDYVEINCETGQVTYNNLNRSRHITMDFQFPIINCGENKIEIEQYMITKSGKTAVNNAKVFVRRKDRWL